MLSGLTATLCRHLLDHTPLSSSTKTTMEQMPGEQQPNFCSHHHSVTTPALWVLSGRLRVTGLAEDKDSR